MTEAQMASKYSFVVNQKNSLILNSKKRKICIGFLEYALL